MTFPRLRAPLGARVVRNLIVDGCQFSIRWTNHVLLWAIPPDKPLEKTLMPVHTLSTCTQVNCRATASMQAIPCAGSDLQNLLLCSLYYRRPRPYRYRDAPHKILHTFGNRVSPQQRTNIWDLLADSSNLACGSYRDGCRHRMRCRL